jgi:hypothetical protein
MRQRTARNDTKPYMTLQMMQFQRSIRKLQERAKKWYGLDYSTGKAESASLAEQDEWLCE